MLSKSHSLFPRDRAEPKIGCYTGFATCHFRVYAIDNMRCSLGSAIGLGFFCYHTLTFLVVISQSDGAKD